MHRNALLGAVLAATCSALLLLLYLRRFEAETSGGDPVRVLVATKAIARGTAMGDGVLSVREIPMAYVDSRMVRASEREKIVGLQTVAPLEAQNVVLWSDLAAEGEERRDLSSLVTPGFRAVYIRATRDDEGAPLIRPGDYVDVIATVPHPGDLNGERSTAVVLLQKVLVLASGGRMSPEEPATSDKHAPSLREQGLTLSLSVQDAQIVAVASERGRFSVALRNPDDQRTLEGIPEVTEAALMARAPGAPPEPRWAGPVRLKDAIVGGPR